MNAQQLRNKANDAPWHIPVMTGGSDHSYVPIRYAGVAKAIYNERLGTYSEYYPEISLASDEKVVEILLVE